MTTARSAATSGCADEHGAAQQAIADVGDTISCKLVNISCKFDR